MTDRTLKWRPTLAAALVAVALIAVSCEAPRPAPLAPGIGSKAPSVVDVSTDVLHEFQVERPVTLVSSSETPKYPRILREAGVEGEVLVSFVVGPNGQADASTFKVIRSTHELFATAVRQALPQMRFVPAEVGGKKVKQLVQHPFAFSIDGVKGGVAPENEVTLQADNSLDERRGRERLILRQRREAEVTSVPDVILYSFEGVELARSERDQELLSKIAPQSIHSIEVFKPASCPAGMTCPLIKIRLARGRTLGQQLIRPNREETAAGAEEPKAETRVATRVTVSEIMSAPMTVELMSSRGEVVARYGSRGEVRAINSEDISASKEYSGKSCQAGSACPLTRIWLKPGREGAYRKQ